MLHVITRILDNILGAMEIMARRVRMVTASKSRLICEAVRRIYSFCTPGYGPICIVWETVQHELVGGNLECPCETRTLI
jgi:hypothetical protein